jgi:RNA polymerase sigma-70 factor, ECF subfamily
MLKQAAPVEESTAAATQLRVTGCLADGGAAEFEQLMRDHNQRLFRLAFSLVGDASEAEDVLQDSYVRAFQRLSTLTARATLGAWLAAIVRNEAIDYLRARGRRLAAFTLEADLGTFDGELSRAIEDASSDSPHCNPEVSFDRDRLRSTLESAIASLPARFRAVFMLREVEGLTIGETAQYLGVPAATIKTRDHRARAMLRRKLGAQFDGAGLPLFEFLRERCDRIVARVLARVHY